MQYLWSVRSHQIVFIGYLAKFKQGSRRVMDQYLIGLKNLVRHCNHRRFLLLDGWGLMARLVLLVLSMEALKLL